MLIENCFVYCVGRAANAVPEIRQRIVDGTPVEYDRCDTSPYGASGEWNICILSLELHAGILWKQRAG